MSRCVYRKHLFLFVLFLYPLCNIYAANDIHNLIYFGCSFTQGNSWARYLSENYGQEAKAGYTNFAISGTETRALPAERNIFYSTNPKYHKNDIFLTYMGPNDFSYYTTVIQNNIALTIHGLDYYPAFLGGLEIPHGQIGPNTAAFLNERIALYRAHVVDLASRSAKNQIIFTHIDEEHRHRLFVANDGPLNFVVEEWNRRLVQSVSGVNANIAIIDLYRLTTEINQNEEMYMGAGNVFYDLSLHPMQRGYKIMSNYVVSIIDAPILVGLARENVIRIGEVHGNGILHELQTLDSSDDGKMKAIILGNIERTNFNNDSNYNGFNGTLWDGVIGALYTKSNITFGGAFGRYYYPFDFSHHRGKGTVQETLGSIFGKLNFKDKYSISVVLGFGQSDYDITRYIVLGMSNREEQGKVDSNHLFGNVQFSGTFTLAGNYMISPSIGMDMQRANGFKYNENGVVRSTTMAFNIADRDSLKPYVGANLKKQIIYDKVTFVPHVSVNVAYELISAEEGDVKAKLLSIPTREFQGFYAVNTPRCIGYLQLGANISRANMEFGVNYNLAENFSTLTSHQIQAMVRYVFG